jgi:CRP/FNR family transcriptional regulator, cyclic AMP receptor protein
MTAHLKQDGFLGSLPSGETARILEQARRRRFRRGDIVFHEGDTGEALHLVAEGRFGVQTGTADGQRVMLEIVSPGSVKFARSASRGA